MNLSIPFPFGWLLNKKAARVEVNISLAFLHWIGIALHPWPFVSDIAIFVLKVDVKLQLTNLCKFTVVSTSVAWWLQDYIHFVCRQYISSRAPSWPGAIPLYPFTFLPSTLSISIFTFPFLLASSIFLLFHPFPFYRKSPTPFPGQIL